MADTGSENGSENLSDDNIETEKEDVLRCFKCKKKEDVKKFNEKTLERCTTALAIKKANNLKTLQDDDVTPIILPTVANDPKIGYCSRPCYSSFVSLNKRYSLPEPVPT